MVAIQGKRFTEAAIGNRKRGSNEGDGYHGGGSGGDVIAFMVAMARWR